LGNRILIAEDEQIIAEDLAFQLETLGHSISGIAVSGEDAVAMAERIRPELAFIDIQLEGKMSGTEAARVIQERTGARIVFVTAYPDIFLRDMSHLKVPGICLKKPFTRSQLEMALRAVGAVSQAARNAGSILP
jgi:CheY-like chemotaxis protein